VKVASRLVLVQPKLRTSPLDPDSRSAVYDISARRVYLPNGEKLEAHSGLGDKIDEIPRAERRARALRVLDLVGLSASAELPVYKMSGGMQQRVSIARALALEPVVLLMDEPFGAVDAFQRATMQRELTRIWKATNASIIFMTHSLDEAIFLGNRVLAMTPEGIGITGELNIDLPRPRDPMSIEFANLKRELFSMLTAHLDAPTNTFSE
jgi:NitT/TauT family transport system ATP-binding protein